MKSLRPLPGFSGAQLFVQFRQQSAGRGRKIGALRPAFRRSAEGDDADARPGRTSSPLPTRTFSERPLTDNDVFERKRSLSVRSPVATEARGRDPLHNLGFKAQVAKGDEFIRRRDSRSWEQNDERGRFDKRRSEPGQKSQSRNSKSEHSPWYYDRMMTKRNGIVDPRIQHDREVLRDFLAGKEANEDSDDTKSTAPRLVPTIFPVPTEHNGARVDYFLPRVIPGLSRSSARLLVLSGKVSIVGRTKPRVYHPDECVASGDKVEVLMEGKRVSRTVEPKQVEDFDEWKKLVSSKPPSSQKEQAISNTVAASKERRKERRESERQEAELEAIVADLKTNRILKTTPTFLFINKPQNLATQPGSYKTELNLADILPRLAEPGETLYLVNRLDKETTGAMVVARDKTTAQELSRLLAENTEDAVESQAAEGVIKDYLALVSQPLKADLPAEGTVRNFIGTFGPPGNEIMRMTDVQTEGSKPATTYYRVLQRFERGALVLMRPMTGRKHQLRAFAANVLNAPIVGDWKYGPRPKKATLGARMCLHCTRLTVAGETAVAPLPDWGQRCEERGISWQVVSDVVDAYVAAMAKA